MTRNRAIPPAAAGLLAALLAAAPSPAATFQGRSVDGRRWQASILNADFGMVDNVEVRFQGDHAYVYFRGTSRLALVLQEEEITDPRCVLADDPKHGIVWEIRVKDLHPR